MPVGKIVHWVQQKKCPTEICCRTNVVAPKNRFEEAATSGDRSVIQNFFCQKTVFDEKEIKIFELRFFMVGCSLVSMLNNHFITCKFKQQRCSSVSRASERSHSGATLLTWVRIPRWTCHYARVIRLQEKSLQRHLLKQI